MTREDELSKALNKMFNTTRGAIQEIGTSIEDAVAKFLLPSEDEVKNAQAKARANAMHPTAAKADLEYKDVEKFREDHEDISMGEETGELISLEGYVVNRPPGEARIAVEGSQGSHVVRVLIHRLSDSQRDAIRSLDLSIPLVKNGDKILIRGYHLVSESGHDVIDAHNVMHVHPYASDYDEEVPVVVLTTTAERNWIEREARKSHVQLGGTTNPAITLIKKLYNASPAEVSK